MKFFSGNPNPLSPLSNINKSTLFIALQWGFSDFRYDFNHALEEYQERNFEEYLCLVEHIYVYVHREILMLLCSLSLHL